MGLLAQGSVMPDRFQLLAFGGRLQGGPPITQQLQEVEAWAAKHGHIVMRSQATSLGDSPPLHVVLGAVRRGEVNAVGVTSLAVLGRSLRKIRSTLGAMTGRARVVLVSGERAGVLDPGSLELTSTIELAGALHAAWIAERERPRRVCPPRVAVDLERVVALQQRGRTLEQISSILAVSRPTISRRLRRARAEHDQFASEERPSSGL